MGTAGTILGALVALACFAVGALRVVEEPGTRPRRAIGAVQVAGATVVAFGLLTTDGFVAAGALLLAAVTIAAVVTHARAGDDPLHFVPALVLLAGALLLVAVAVT